MLSSLFSALVLVITIPIAVFASSPLLGSISPFDSHYQDYSKHGPPGHDRHHDNEDGRLRGDIRLGSDHGVDIDLSRHPWIPASSIPGSSRSPCPLLNTLANHGFLPRSGRNVTMTNFNDAQITALNLDPHLANVLTANGFRLLGFLTKDTNWTTRSIDLETLNNFTTGNDHDASLSRHDHLSSKDRTPGGTPLASIVPSQGLISQLLSDTPGRYLTTRSLGLSRIRRDRESLAAGSLPLRAADKVASFREAGLIIQFIGEGGDPNEVGGGAEMFDQRRAEKRRVGEWLRFERFPRGWRRTRHQVTVAGDMLPLAARVEFWQGEWAKQRNISRTSASEEHAF